MRKHASPGPLTDAQAFCSGMEKALKTNVLRFLSCYPGLNWRSCPVLGLPSLSTVHIWKAFIVPLLYAELKILKNCMADLSSPIPLRYYPAHFCFQADG